jgi:sugar transferase (PEP-CTERM system associated)
MLKIGGQIVPPKTLFLVASESVVMLFAEVIATFVHLDWNSAIAYVSSFHAFARFGLVVVICQLCMYYNDLYNLQMVRRRATFFVQLMQALGGAYLILAAIYYFNSGITPGRGITLLAAPIIVVCVYAWRVLLDATGFSLRGPERTLVMGTGDQGITLVREILRRPEFNIRLVGFLDEYGQNIGKSLVNPCIIGATADVENIVEREKVHRVVLAMKERRGTTPVRELLKLKFKGIAVEDAHSLYERVTGSILLERLSPSAFILAEGFRKSRLVISVKRAMDVLISAALLTLTLPLTVLVALAIKIEDNGPVFFNQTRVGLSGHCFEMKKFRSMYVDLDARPSWTSDGDKRITRVGKIIRKFRIDELPQLWHVLRGEMSLVGPRPEQPYFCELLDAQIPFFSLRHSVRPGITGWAQIKYPYGASVEDARKKLQLDLFYIKHLSPSLDLAILFETVKVVVLGRGAK